MATDVKQDSSMHTSKERKKGGEVKGGRGGWRREGMDGEACKGMGLGGGVSHTPALHVIKTDKIKNVIHTYPIFIVSSKDPPYVCFE